MRFCASDSKCIRHDQLCDGVRDCSNGSDETGCGQALCTRSGCMCNETMIYDHSNNRCIVRDVCREFDGHLCDQLNRGHKCITVVGGYECRCAIGYHNFDGHTCVADIDRSPPMLLHGGVSSIKFHPINERMASIYKDK